MTFGGNSFKDSAKNQLTKFRVVLTVEADGLSQNRSYSVRAKHRGQINDSAKNRTSSVMSMMMMCTSKPHRD